MKYNTKQTLKFYLTEIKKHQISAWLMALSITAAALIDVIVPLYYKSFFDILSAAGPGATKALISILIAIAVWEFVQWIFWRISGFAGTSFATKVMQELGDLCFKNLHRHSFSFFNNNFSGSLVRRVNKFVYGFERINDQIDWQLLPLFVNLIFMIGVLFFRNVYLGIGLIVWTLIFIAVNAIFIKFKLKYDVASSETDSELTGFLADTITNNTNVKLFNGYKKEIGAFSKINERLRNLNKKAWDFSNWFEGAQGFLMVILEIAITYGAIILWERKMITIGDFVLIQSYILTIMMKIWGLGRTIQFIYQELARAEEMTEILIAPYEIQDIPNAKKLRVNSGRIEFIDVSFNYQEKRRVISNLNINIKPKEKLGLVGPSGAGKSTFVKLLLRMHDVTKGQILIDGQNISQVTQESLWQNISLVPQDPILFHRTLRENISYGKPGATTTEIIRAAKLAHCHEFIKNLSEGYNTYVGERGVKLSGGERQRVAIARAILRNSPILLLDEATSSLDSHSELLIQDALTNLMQGKTVIVIAHRLSTIMKMDRIILIDYGKIKEEGTHDELLRQKASVYKKLWDIQAGGFAGNK